MLAFARRLRVWLLPVFLFFLLITPTFAATSISYFRLRNQLTQETFSERRSLAKQIASTVESRLDAIRDVGRVSASNIAPLVARGDWEEAVAQLEPVSKEFPYIDRIFLSNLEGITTAYYPPSPENVGKDFSFRDWYKGVSKDWQPYVSEVFKRAPYPQYNTVAVMSPIRDAEGQPLGAVGFAVNLDSFYELTEEFKIDRGGFLYIVNQKGQIVAHPKYESQGELIDFSSVPTVQKLLAGESGAHIAFNPIENENRLAAYEKVEGYDWGVVVADPIATAFGNRDMALSSVLLIDASIVFVNSILAITILIILRKLRGSREKLRLENERFSFVSKATNDVIYDWNVLTNHLWFSEGMQKLFGYSESQVQENLDWWSSLIHPEDQARVNKHVEDMMGGTSSTIAMEYRFKRADGTYAFVEDRAYLSRDSYGKPVRWIGVIQDFTKERQLEELKDEFVSVASHELRTPMTAIKGFISMIQDGDYGPVPEKLNEPLEDVAKSTERLIHLVNDMLNLSRIEAGRLKYDLGKFEATDIVKDVIASLQPVAKAKNITLLSEGLEPCSVQADKDKLDQVLNNLIGNSLKFTDKGGITISSKKEGDSLKIFVKDTGMGIDPEDQKRLFGKFVQVTSQQDGKPAGTGLGLYISREIVKKMGGDMWIEKSEIGKGSTFGFSIPVYGTAKAAEVLKNIEIEAQSHPDQKDMS